MKANQIKEDIGKLSELEGVSVQVIEEGFLPLGGNMDGDGSLSVVFEESLPIPLGQKACRLEIIIRFKRCIYGIKPRRDTTITIGVDIPADFPESSLLMELVHVSNAASQLTRLCARALSEASSIMAHDNEHDGGIYSLVSGFYWFLKEQVVSEHDKSSSMSFNYGSSYNQNSSKRTANDSSYTSSMEFSQELYNLASENSSAQLTQKVVETGLGLYRSDSKTHHDFMAAHSRYYREFEQEKVLGFGSFGCVTKVMRNGVNYAVKQIPIYKSYGTTLHQEAAVLASLQHINIVRYYDAWTENPYENMKKEAATQQKHMGSSLYLSAMTNDIRAQLKGSREIRDKSSSGYGISSSAQRKVRFGNQQRLQLRRRRQKKYGKPIKYLYILMEYCEEETLFDAICDKRLMDNPQIVIELLRQILEALSYIHEKGIIHRDVKPSNIFLKSEGDALFIKLGDFGLTAKMSQASTDPVGCPSDVVGTLHYMSPEQAKGQAYGEKVDIFAAGVVLFEMLSPPFDTAMERFEVLSSFSAHEKKWPSEFQSRIDNRIFKMLESMLSVDPDKRPSASQLLQNEIFASYKLDTSTLYHVVTEYPHSMESTQLLRSMFSRSEPREKEFLFFEGISEEIPECNYVSVELARRYIHEFRSRGAIRYEAPLFLEQTADAFPEAKDKEPYIILLADGRSCQLRHSILMALVDSMPQAFLVIMRRWYWGKVYFKDPNKGQRPGESWACAYDIIADYSILLQEMGPTEEMLDAFFCSELMFVASRPLLKFMPCSMVMEWTHSSFISRVLEDGMGIRDNWSLDLEEIIIENHKKQTVMKQKVSEYLRVVSVPGVTTDALLNYIMQFLNALSTGAVTSLNDFLASITRIISPMGRDLSRLNSYMSSLMYMERFLTIKECEFVFMPVGFPSWHRSRYTTFSFSITYVLGKKSLVSLVSGGCVNSLMQRRTRETLDPPNRRGFGFEINLQALIQYFDQQEASVLGRGGMEGLQLGCRLFPQVLICISHLSLLPQAMNVEQQLHKAGIIVEKQLGLPSGTRKLNKHVLSGLFALSRLELMVHIKSYSITAASTVYNELERHSNAPQYKIIYVHLGKEIILNEEKELVSMVCSQVYRRYL